MNAYGLDKRYGFEDYASANPVPGTGMRYEVHTDYLGSIVAVVDPVTGAIVSRCDYDSFGRRSVVAGAVDPGYGFTGQQYDAETGLQYHRARYYDPGGGAVPVDRSHGLPGRAAQCLCLCRQYALSEDRSDGVERVVRLVATDTRFFDQWHRADAVGPRGGNEPSTSGAQSGFG